MAERILTLRELNRATLARQFLLERTNKPALAMIHHLIALQGQVSNAPYVGLWTRLRAFARDELTALLSRRVVVRASSLRGTLHILTADDYLLIHPLLQRGLSAQFRLFAQRTPGFALERFVDAMRVSIQERPRTSTELQEMMEEFAPGMGEPRISDAVRMSMALLQIPPAGAWGFTGRPAHTEATAWLGRPLADQETAEAALPDLVRRYLAAFGPASVKDMQTWSRLTGLRRTFDALRPELRVYRDEQGRELFDLAESPLPSGETPAPARFLPEYENAVLGYDERRRILLDEHRDAAFTRNGMLRTFLVDGFVRGAWRLERRPAAATLLVEPFAPLASTERDELQQEGERLLRWAVDGVEPLEIQFSAAP